MLLLAGASRAQAVTDEQVGQAIARIKAYFFNVQIAKDGNWEISYPKNEVLVGGETALVTLSLLTAGESPQRPEMLRALNYLQGVDLKSTYARSIRAHVWARLPEAYLPFLDKDGRWLIDQGQDGLARYHYVAKPSQSKNRADGDWDNSTTQYGILGVWEVAKRGGKVPPEFWEHVAEHFFLTQNIDGGWQYQVPTGTSSHAMSAAGLTGLYVAQQQLQRDINRPNPKLTDAINRGLGWFDKNFTPGGAYYYLYGLERVGIASGVKILNKQDWFQAGASRICGEVRADGSVGSPVDTAFALMFLARGRVPVWVSKLGIPGAVWNNYPNDLENLSRHLSDQRLAELNWQVVDVDTAPEIWLNAPLLVIGTDRPPELTDQQKRNIKRYIDLGGTVLFNPDRSQSAVGIWARKLAAELYPNYPVRKLPNDHILFNAHFQFPAGAQQGIFGVSNGAREVMLILESDWSGAFQGRIDNGRSTTWKLASNLWAIVTDRGLIPNRLVPRYEARGSMAPTKQLAIARVSYEGNWLPEPAAWEAVGNHLFNHAGAQLQVVDVPLEKLGTCTQKLAHLSGVGPLKLTELQREAIITYIKAGGTILYETVGGKGEFSKVMEEQLVELLKTPPVPVSGDEPFLSGKDVDKAYPMSEVVYRRYSVLQMQPGRRARLVTFTHGDRPAVIGSREDLSEGALGVRHWGISGYQPQSALRMMTNLALWAHAPPPPTPKPAATTAPVAQASPSAPADPAASAKP